MHSNFGEASYSYQEEQHRSPRGRRMHLQDMPTTALSPSSAAPNVGTRPEEGAQVPTGVFAAALCGSSALEVERALRSVYRLQHSVDTTAARAKERQERGRLNLFSWSEYPPREPVGSPLGEGSREPAMRSGCGIPATPRRDGESSQGATPQYRTSCLPVYRRGSEELARLKPTDKDQQRSMEVEACFVNCKNGKLADFGPSIGVLQPTYGAGQGFFRSDRLDPLPHAFDVPRQRCGVSLAVGCGRGGAQPVHLHHDQHFSVFSHASTPTSKLVSHPSSPSSRSGNGDATRWHGHLTPIVEPERTCRVKQVALTPVAVPPDGGYVGLFSGLGSRSLEEGIPVHIPRKSPRATWSITGSTDPDSESMPITPREVFHAQRGHPQLLNPDLVRDRVSSLMQWHPESYGLDASSPGAAEGYAERRRRELPPVSREHLHPAMPQPQSLCGSPQGLLPDSIDREVKLRGIRTRNEMDHRSAAPHRYTLLHLMRSEAL